MCDGGDKGIDPLSIVIHSRDQYQAMGCTSGNLKDRYTTQGLSRLGARNVLSPVYRPQQLPFDSLLIESHESTYRKCCAVDVRRTSTTRI